MQKIECKEFPGTYWDTTVDGRSVTVRLMRTKDGLPVEVATRRRLFKDGLVKRTSDGESAEVSTLDPLDLTTRLMREVVFEVRSYERRH